MREKLILSVLPNFCGFTTTVIHSLQINNHTLRSAEYGRSPPASIENTTPTTFWLKSNYKLRF